VTPDCLRRTQALTNQVKHLWAPRNKLSFVYEQKPSIIVLVSAVVTLEV
jgi:hypothetical protein